MINTKSAEIIATKLMGWVPMSPPIGEGHKEYRWYQLEPLPQRFLQVAVDDEWVWYGLEHWLDLDDWNCLHQIFEKINAEGLSKDFAYNLYTEMLKPCPFRPRKRNVTDKITCMAMISSASKEQYLAAILKTIEVKQSVVK